MNMVSDFGGRPVVRRLLLICGLPLLACVAMPALAQKKAPVEKPPTVTYDRYTKKSTITGEVHRHMPLLSGESWQYWLNAVIENGVPLNPMLMVSTLMPDRYLFTGAADSDGTPLPILNGSTQRVASLMNELVGIEMTPDYLAAHRKTGFDIKLLGRQGSIIVTVSPEIVAAFETTYLEEVAKAGGFRGQSAAAQPAPGVSAQVSNPEEAAAAADLMKARGGFGISFAIIPQGFALLSVAPGSRADQGRLRPGQIVTAVNGRSVAGMTQEAVVAMLKASGGVTTFSVLGAGELAVDP